MVPGYAEGVRITLTAEEKKFLEEPYEPRAIVSGGSRGLLWGFLALTALFCRSRPVTLEDVS